MGTTCDLTVPSVSGAFLHDTKKFLEIYRIWKKFYKVSVKSQENEAQLLNCNNPEWLLRFGKRCQRRKLDPKEELIALTRGLEAEKVNLTAQMEEARRELHELEPTLFPTLNTLVQPFLPSLAAPGPRQGITQPEVAARNAVIDAHLDEPDLAICEMLDLEFPVTDRPADELPNSWACDFEIRTFVQAYAACPNRVHKLISVRRRVRRPYP